MELNRRRALQAGTTLVFATAVSGCLGNGDDDADDRDDANGRENGDDDDGQDERNGRQAGELAIEHLRLLADQPTDYREYEPVEDRRYSADSVVWFYFEPVGVTTEDAGEGQKRIELSSSLTVTRRGETVTTVEEQFHRDIADGATDELYLFFQFTSPITPPPSGRYSAELSLTDELADQTVTETASFTIEADVQIHELGIDHVRFVDAEPTGFREYTAVADPVYDASDDIWMYFEPTGIAVEQQNADGVTDFQASATLTDPDGEDAGRVSDRVTLSIPDGESTDELFVYFELSLREPRVGEYTVELSVFDRLLMKEATETTTFTIDDVGLERLEILREVVEDETDIDIHSLRLRDEGEQIRLRYDSAVAYEDNPDEFSGEVGYIAGAYAGLLDEAFMPVRLSASGEDTSGAEFRYRVESDIAIEFLEEEITDEEFIDAVFETLSFEE